MTETTKHTGGSTDQVRRRRKSAVWKSGLLAAGLSAVALGGILLARDDAAVNASTQLISSANTSDDSGWSDYQIEDDGGFLVASPRHGRRVPQWQGDGFTAQPQGDFAAQPQFFGPMTRTRGS